MAASDSRPVPRKNVAFRFPFPILDADGDPVSGAGGLDSEYCIDYVAFTDCSNEAIEIGSSGIYYLDLEASEMNGDSVIVQIKTTSTGAKTSIITLFPDEAGDFRVDTVMLSGDSTAADNAEAMFDGTGYAGGTIKLGVDTVAISGDATAADNAELMFDGTGYAGGTTKLQVDTVLISGDTTAADNAEAFFDGTGYAGGTTKLQVDTVLISGDTTAADNAEAFFDGTGYVGGTAKLTVDVVKVNGSAVPVTTATLISDAVTEASVTSAVWDRGLAGHTTAGTAGKTLSDVLVDTGTTLDGKIDTIDTNVDSILADTGTDGVKVGAAAITSASFANDAIVAAAINTGAITSAKFAAGAIDAAAIADNAIDAGAIASDAIAAAKIATGAITAAKFAAGAIDATAVAAGAITSATFATDAITSTSLHSSAVDEILDDTIGDGTLTARQALRVVVAALAGKLSGAATTTITIRNAADSADVIVATVDADGNRSAVTVTP